MFAVLGAAAGGVVGGAVGGVAAAALAAFRIFRWGYTEQPHYGTLSMRTNECVWWVCNQNQKCLLNVSLNMNSVLNWKYHHKNLFVAV